MIFLKLGTPAARMTKVPSTIVKNRSCELTSVFEAFTPNNGMEDRVERIWITEIATGGIHLVRIFATGKLTFAQLLCASFSSCVVALVYTTRCELKLDVLPTGCGPKLGC